jgi:hypothetical protein
MYGADVPEVELADASGLAGVWKSLVDAVKTRDM